MNTNLLAAGALSLVLLGPLSAAAVDTLPAQGQFEPGLEAFDGAVQTFMGKNRISAGQVAIMRHGEVIFDRSYGWQDQKQRQVLQIGALMRIASVTKPFTAAAIRQLIDAKRLALDTHVFNLGQPGGGVLDLEPPSFGAQDPRLKDITIEHCLLHKGGWDRGPDSSNDLTYFEIRAAKALQIPSPPDGIDMARYIIRQPLQFDPGSHRIYSNVGYLMLGLVIEKVSGKKYLPYVYENVTRLAGIPDKDVLLASSFRKDADPREPYYDDAHLARNVFYPAYSNVPKVEAPYGSFNMEARTGEGRILTTARSLLLFLDKFTVNGPSIGRPRAPHGDWRWHHDGKQRGSEATARQRGDGINYAIIFNKAHSADEETDEVYVAQMRRTFDALIDRGAIKSRPKN